MCFWFARTAGCVSLVVCLLLSAAGGFAEDTNNTTDPVARTAAHRALPPATPGASTDDRVTPRYHWRGLLLQSLEFNFIENGIRLAADHNMRDQIAHQPYWRDYANSLDHFNMNRWNDGDDFLVNGMGHSMQGAVAADLEIQNSEVAARTRFGEPGYGMSRFRAFLWSVAYSTQSEIGPIGEAAIGSEGGYTYGVNCLEKCTPKNFQPGDKFTNNTGWVDFIVTPLGGMLIVVAEDVVDKKISDSLAEKLQNHPLAARILRGSLNPARSWSNLLRGQTPWYRDYDHPWSDPDRGVHFVKSDEQVAAEAARPRYELSPHFSSIRLATNHASCLNCPRLVIGQGVEASRRLLPWLDADADVSYMSGASPLPGDRAGGNLTAAFFGVRTGVRSKHYSLQIALRPGFVRFDRAQQTSPTTTFIYPKYPGTTVNAAIGETVTNPAPALGPITHFAWNLNLTGDYRVNRALALRAGIAESIIRYRTHFVDAPSQTPPYISYLSPQNFMNRGSWSLQFGPVLSF